MRKFTLFSPALALLLFAHSAAAATTNQYWDPNGTASIGGNGIWNTTSEFSPVSTQVVTASLVRFTNGNVAVFSAGPNSSGSQGSLNVTINRTNVCGGIDNGNDGPGSCLLTFTGSGSGLLQVSGTVNTAGATASSTTFNVVLIGTGDIVFAGPWPCYLNESNTYTGNTTISNNGTLALGVNGSINGSPQITIMNGSTLDVSAISSFVLSTNTTMKATGSAKPASIIGGTTVNLGSQPIVMTYDGTHPALTIAQGTLTLNGNAFTINKSVALTVGTYTIIQQTTGNITTNAGTFPVTGTAIAAGYMGAISVSGGSVILTVSADTATTTTLNTLIASTYGQSVTFTATVAPTPPGGTVQFYDNSVALGSPVTVSGGTASYTTNTLSVGNHPITATYSGTTGYLSSSTASASTQEVDLPPNNTPATITSSTVLSNGTLQLNFTGEPGYTYVIQTATNLIPPVTWININTNMADTNGLFNFNDKGNTNYNVLFYRTTIPQ